MSHCHPSDDDLHFVLHQRCSAFETSYSIPGSLAFKLEDYVTSDAMSTCFQLVVAVREGFRLRVIDWSILVSRVRSIKRRWRTYEYFRSAHIEQSIRTDFGLGALRCLLGGVEETVSPFLFRLPTDLGVGGNARRLPDLRTF